MTTHAAGELDGYCQDCIAEQGKGYPVCRGADPAGPPNDDHCAWCGHPVTTSAGVGGVPAQPTPALAR